MGNPCPSLTQPWFCFLLQVNAVTVDGITPLFNACRSGSAVCVNLLLEYDACPHLESHIASPVHEAVKRGILRELDHSIRKRCGLATDLFKVRAIRVARDWDKKWPQPFPSCCCHARDREKQQIRSWRQTAKDHSCLGSMLFFSRWFPYTSSSQMF